MKKGLKAVSRFRHLNFRYGISSLVHTPSRMECVRVSAADAVSAVYACRGLLIQYYLQVLLT